MNWSDFFNMGGYAAYVWTSWGLTVAILLWQFIQPKRENAKIKAEIKRQMRRQQKLASRTSTSN